MIRRHPLRAAAVLVAVLAAVALALTTLPSDHFLVLPDRARPTDPLVRIEGEQGEEEEADGNGVYMVDVTIGRASLFERLFPQVHEGASLVPEHVVNPQGVSDRQRRRSSLNAMSRSQLVAVTVALRELGEEVEVEPRGAEVVLVQEGTPAEGTLQVGDVIVAAEGQETGTITELRRATADVQPGEPIHLTVERGEQRLELTVGTQASPDLPGRAVMGVQVQNAEEFDFPLEVEIDAGQIGGPSAGLAFALDIVDELRGDLTRGRRIVATGELGLDGEVTAVGGVKQKTIAARRAGADLFLVPRGNVAEARAAGDDLPIVPVSTFEEALAHLATP